MAEQGNISPNVKQSVSGINLDSIASQITQGQLSWALNAVISSFDGKQVTYSNEQGNYKCFTFPTGYTVMGVRNIIEEGIIIFWLVNESTGDSEIGKGIGCTYSTLINARCLNLSIDSPILKHAHRNTNCGLEVYWVEGRNNARFIQLEALPYKETAGCPPQQTTEIDCNKLNLQPNFTLPNINVQKADSGGDLKAGMYQFSTQYANALGEPYTSFYNTTNGAPVFDNTQPTQNFDFSVNTAFELSINNIDTTGIFDYINIAVVKTINNISSVDLIGTYKITGDRLTMFYTGQRNEIIKLDINDIFQRYEVFDKPNDLTTAQDVLILSNLSESDRISYQQIANKIRVKWATIRLSGKHPYKDPNNSVNHRGYMRDEVYPLELVVKLTNGYISDGFHIPGRVSIDSDLELIDNPDSKSSLGEGCDADSPAIPRWKVYNTGNVTSTTTETDPCYEGEWQSGDMSYWESSESYDCNPDVWGELAGVPIRHHKFPDSLITHIHDNNGYIYPIGIKVNVQQIVELIRSSNLSQTQKDNIQSISIFRGSRVNNSSVIAKGLVNNVLKYDTRNNIIDSSTGQVGDGQTGGAETTGRKLLEDAFDFTQKGHREFVSFSLLSAIAVLQAPRNIKQIARYVYAEKLISRVRSSPPTKFFTQDNVVILQTASRELQDIIDNSRGDIRGKSHAQAAKALVDGLISFMESEIELEATLGEVDVTDLITADSSKFAYFPNFLFNDVRVDGAGKPKDFFLDNTIIDDDAKQRWAFHSPDTHFYQPSIGPGIKLKLETAEYGASTGHIREVHKHARYQFISEIGYITALLAGLTIGFASGTYGVTAVNVFNGQAMFSAYQAFLNILYKTVPRKNFAQQYNAVGEYTKFVPIANSGNKQRTTDLATYISPGMLNVDDKYTLNNFQRESAVYLRTLTGLPFTHEIAGVPHDASKLAAATFDPIVTPISSYYVSIKNDIVNQYGQMYSYETVDTGWTKDINLSDSYNSEVVFGGDVFINRFAFKNKLPLFIDNRVGFPDDADISYNELSNVGRVKYWFSTDVIANTSFFDSFFATMTQHFFWPQIKELYLSGMIFLFAYGIPYFYCESNVNVDLRQAHNPKEGDFYPRVSSGIPDEWLQEINVSIQNDNSYWYNKGFSKQNKETFIAHLPPDYDFNTCRTVFPFRAIFSEPNTDNPNPSNRNNWRIFKPASRFDFPQNYGRLISLDGIDDRQVVARFENKSLLYNALLTAPTSAADVYLGSSLFSKQVPPLDYADTDVGYAGTLNKFFLKTEYGDITADSKRGQVFLINGREAKDISALGVSKFMTEFLDFQLNKTFPEINMDNPFKGLGIHGTYDSKYNRLIITKLDYKPLLAGITHTNGVFKHGTTTVQLSDTAYFANYSFTASFSFDTNSWVSLHSYLPNYYIAEANYFYTGNSQGAWQHNTSITKFNNFYDTIHPYILEYPYQYQYNDEILQNIKDYSNVLQYTDFREFIETDEYYFNKMVAYSNQQSTGLLELLPKPKNNLNAQKGYPKYNTASKTILVTKSGSFYNVNTFWDMIKDTKKPVWNKSLNSLSEYKVLNQDNHNYNKLSYSKAPLRSKELRIRLILDNKDDIKIISQFTVAPAMQSYK